MVIPMINTWTTKYRNRMEFLAHFDSEQDFIDAMFIQIIMFNYGTWLDKDKLNHKDT